MKSGQASCTCFVVAKSDNHISASGKSIAADHNKSDTVIVQSSYRGGDDEPVTQTYVPPKTRIGHAVPPNLSIVLRLSHPRGIAAPKVDHAHHTMPAVLV